MTNLGQLSKLEDKRETILLSEIGALIHDIGKLSDNFVNGHTKNGNSKFYHAAILNYDNQVNNGKISNLARDIINDLEQANTTLNGKKGNILRDCIQGHHRKKFGEKEDNFDFTYPEKKDYEQNLRTIVDIADVLDSDEDRYDFYDESDKQDKNQNYHSNAFGKEKKLNIDYKKRRKEVYSKLNKKLGDYTKDSLSKDRSNIIQLLKKKFNTLGMTVRAANDVTLWEHSYMTACISKALINESILQSEFPMVEDVNEINEEKPFQILSVGWNYFDFLSQGQKISDITGRGEVIEELKEEIKQTIELEYLLGNSIYEDEKGLHFLIPAGFKETEKIKDEIFQTFNKKTGGIFLPKIRFTERFSSLKDIINEAIEKLEDAPKTVMEAPKWSKKYEDSTKQYLCNNCGKRLYEKDSTEEICEKCKEIRNKENSETPYNQTKFVDEIAWDGEEYQNIALITLNFELKDWLRAQNLQTINFGPVSVNNLEDELGDELGDNLNSSIGPKIPEKDSIENINLTGPIKDFDEHIFQKNRLISKLETLENKIKGQKATDKLRRKKLNRLNNFLSNFYSYQNKKFNPKNPSPSRLMRVWNTTNGYFESLEENVTEEDIDYLEEVNESENVNLPVIEEHERLKLKLADKDRFTAKYFEKFGALEIEIESTGKKGEAVIWSKEIEGKNHRKYFIDIVTPDTYRDLEKEEITVRIIDERVNMEQEFTGQATEHKYYPFRTLSTSPNQFMFLAPANKTEEIMELIRKKYEEEIGKVYGKLPLNIGIVYGKRKTPMFSMIDAARRFRETHKENDEDEDEDDKDKPQKNYKVIKEPEEKDNGKVELKIRPEKYNDGFERKIKVPYTLGNGEPDFYHPYLKVDPEEVENEGDVIEIETDSEDGQETISQLHVTKIEEGDVIELDKANFDLEFLNTNRKRFNLDKEREHEVVGTSNDNARPYTFEEWQKFEKLGKIFGKIGRWNPIRDIESVAAEKREEWSDSEGELKDNKKLYRNFISDLLENKLTSRDKKKIWGGDDPIISKKFLVNSIIDGTFFDALKLYNSILNIKLGDNND